MIKFTRHRGIAKAIQLEKKIITMNFNSDRIILEICKFSIYIKNLPCKSQWGPFKTSLHHLGYNQIRWGTSNDSGTCKIFFEKTLGTIQLKLSNFFSLFSISQFSKTVILKLLVGLCLPSNNQGTIPVTIISLYRHPVQTRITQ